MPSSSNVSAGKPKVTGAIFIAPVGTTLPTDSTTALATAFVELGYASDAGVVNSESRETETIKAWGGDTVLKPFTGKEDTFKFTLIEALNVNALKLVYGDSNVTGDLTNGISIKSAAEDLDYHSFVIEMVLNGAIKRIVIPSAKVTSLEELDEAIESMLQTEGSFLLEACVTSEENVFPMIPAGATIDQIFMDKDFTQI